MKPFIILWYNATWEIKQLQGNLLVYKKFGYIEIDDAGIDATCDAYFKWKDLNTYIKNTSER